MNNKYLNKECSVIMPDGTYPATVIKFVGEGALSKYTIKLNDSPFAMQAYQNLVESRFDDLEFTEYAKPEFYAC
tara:strand:- start:996 stop:1217 length:222 start_codon:yes stop_codon:yes gene_type:complete